MIIKSREQFLFHEGISKSLMKNQSGRLRRKPSGGERAWMLPLFLVKLNFSGEYATLIYR